jgi:hypothetical protein
MPDPPVRTPRRQFTVSLRVLMLLVLVAGIPIGWKTNRARKQRRAVAAIVKAGGQCIYDYEYVDGILITNGRPWAPEWLRRRLGDEYFQEVTCVHFFEEGLADEQLAPLEGLDHVEEIEIPPNEITDAGLAHLADCGRIGDEGLIHLRRLTNLEVLNLSMTRLTDAGLVHRVLAAGVQS